MYLGGSGVELDAYDRTDPQSRSHREGDEDYPRHGCRTLTSDLILTAPHRDARVEQLKEPSQLNRSHSNTHL